MCFRVRTAGCAAKAQGHQRPLQEHVRACWCASHWWFVVACSCSPPVWLSTRSPPSSLGASKRPTSAPAPPKSATDVRHAACHCCASFPSALLTLASVVQATNQLKSAHALIGRLYARIQSLESDLAEARAGMPPRTASSHFTGGYDPPHSPRTAFGTPRSPASGADDSLDLENDPDTEGVDMLIEVGTGSCACALVLCWRFDHTPLAWVVHCAQIHVQSEKRLRSLVEQRDEQIIQLRKVNAHPTCSIRVFAPHTTLCLSACPDHPKHPQERQPIASGRG